LADRFAISAVEERNENQRGANNDKGDVTIPWLETPDVEGHDLGDAKQEQAETGEAEAALVNREREEHDEHTFNAPRHCDHAGAHFQGEHAGEQNDWNEKQQLFRAADDGCP
jgi:hypothetical protein